MTSVQERLQIKREPIDKWSVREQLSLASAVARSGDQNWMSVSRALKPFGDPNRPSDWFHQKHCAAQYGVLLENVETPKRKKRTSGAESVLETPAESILRRLTNERLGELKKLMAEERAEFIKLQEDMAVLQKGNISEEQLDQWCKEIDEEEHQKEQETMAHSKWLKERELRKQEIERVWRPMVKMSVPSASQKRKASESIEGFADIEATEEIITTPITDPGKSALSPLLTSLLKSPAHAQNVVTSSILHTAITSQRPTTTNPTIASLLNSSTNVTVSPGLQQLVSSAIGQESSSTHPTDSEEIASPELPDDAADILPNLKVEDILASDEPLPEIKNEEVEVIISDLIENAEIVTNPEEHLQLDGNVDLMDNLENELEELVNEEKAAKDAAALQEAKQDNQEKNQSNVDPFEFQEDPEFYEQPPMKQSPNVMKQEVVITDEATQDIESPPPPPPAPPQHPTMKVDEMKLDEPMKIEKHEIQGGSVEIVEVVVMEEEEIDKELNKSQIEDIVHSNKIELPTSSIIPKEEIKEEVVEEQVEKDSSICEESNTESIDMETKSEPDGAKDDTNETDAAAAAANRTTNIFTPEFGEELYDDGLNMEIKVDKSGKAKRDYSRTKKKEDKDMELLFEVEQAQLEEELTETNSEKEFQEIEKKSEGKLKIKSENEGSNSPWLEEEDTSNASKTRRRYSTPGTPVDSVPNSPLSGVTCEDDRDYRNWKKSVMLVYNRLTTHKFSSIFLKPITNDQAPGYHNIVYRPMDLQTIRKNIENGSIRTTIEFHRDVLLMFNNAIIYNKTNEHIYNMARQMQQESVQQIQILFQAQTDTPARRETRTSEPGSKRKRGIEEPTKNKKKKED